MKSSRGKLNLLAFAALTLSSTVAMATCKPVDPCYTPPKPTTPPPTTTTPAPTPPGIGIGVGSTSNSTNDNLAKAAADARAASLSKAMALADAKGGNASIGKVSNSATGGRSSAKGGSARQSQSQGLSNAGNSQTRVDAGDRSTSTYNARATAWAPVIHGPAAPALAANNIMMAPSACGPRVKVVREPIIGYRFGAMGGQEEVVLGYGERVIPEGEVFMTSGGYVLGHSVTAYTTTLGTSSAGSFSVAGFTNNGGGAQGGAGHSGVMEQLAQRYTVLECIFGVVAPAPAQPMYPGYVTRQRKGDRN